MKKLPLGFARGKKIKNHPSAEFTPSKAEGLRARKSKIFVILIFAFSILHSKCFADPISSKELIQNAREYDGREIVFQGEAIGDIMKRGNFYWVNISDGKNALGVFLDKSALSGIMFTGDYGHVGDTIEVKGIFHRACLEHGGDLDIHASYMTKLKDGYKIIRKIDQKKVRAVLWLAVILFIVIIVAMITKKVKKMADIEK